jgi:hypothetical protein
MAQLASQQAPRAPLHGASRLGFRDKSPLQLHGSNISASKVLRKIEETHSWITLYEFRNGRGAALLDEFI